MTVHFIGAGPGAADLITVRGAKLLAACPVCLYAGSIVSPELLQHCPPGTKLVDTAPLSLDEIEAEFAAAHRAGQDVARLHSGDLSVWSAVAEQIRRLEKHGIPYTLTPGVPAFAAAAAALGRELTIPEVAQSAGADPRFRPRLENAGGRDAGRFRRDRRDARHPSRHPRDRRIVAELTPLYGADCPVAIVFRASWPDERILRGTLATSRRRLAADPIERTAIIFVGRSLAAERISRKFALRRRTISGASGGGRDRYERPTCARRCPRLRAGILPQRGEGACVALANCQPADSAGTASPPLGEKVPRGEGGGCESS